ncbi:hypothetical protein [Rothia nasimurium]|uniref:hypothetical protein n=1 Tax=Rothia nasimurium TaxID=85336 RepID=UPI001F35166B|nr:hypothetical protein [Rothia nasimurium]
MVALRTLGYRLGAVYKVFFYLVFWLALAGSFSVSLRQVRGSYLYFTLEDFQAPGFFMGGLLIAGAGLVWLFYQLGPLAYSPAELFWRYSGLSYPSRNPWHFRAIWVALGIWALLSVMLATIFAPLSVTWLVGTALGAVAFGVLMLHGMAAAQLLGRLKFLLAWAGLAAVTGLLLLIATTTDSVISANVALIYCLGALVLFLGILGTLVLVISAQNSPLERVAATQGFGRSTLLLYAVRNLSGAQGYRYYGGQRGTFRRKLVNSRSYLLSLAALADSLAPLVLTTLLSIPLGIFVGVGFGASGIGIVTIVGVWLIAFFYRWLPREWSAQLPLRQWLTAPYFSTLLGFIVGAGVATVIYAVAMTIIFQLPGIITGAALFFGIAVALGETDPLQEYDYSLVVALPSGLVVPVQPLVAASTVAFQIGVVALAVFSGTIQGLLIPLAFCLWRLGQHYSKGRTR